MTWAHVPILFLGGLGLGVGPGCGAWGMGGLPGWDTSKKELEGMQNMHTQGLLM